MLRTLVALSVIAAVSFTSCSQDPIQEELINHAAALRPDGYSPASIALAFDTLPTTRNDDDRMRLLEPGNLNTSKPSGIDEDNIAELEPDNLATTKPVGIDEDNIAELEPDNLATNKPDGYVDANAPVVLKPKHNKAR
jgi:hypothetical protein